MKEICGGRLVDASYTKPMLSCDEGNIFIEALPPKMSRKELLTFHYKRFPIVPSTDADPLVQENEIMLLDQLRIPLGYTFDLEERFRLNMECSYRQRLRDLHPYHGNITMDDKTVSQCARFDYPNGGNGHTGAALLGIGGCGKSTAIDEVVSHYPQVIRHSTDNGSLLQIVWLKVETSMGSDLATLFSRIGTAFDIALGNTNVYGPLVTKAKKIGEKADIISNLIRCFAVGTLIIDEIQRLDRNRNRSESYEAIMAITNATKVSLLVAGTEESFALLFQKYYTTRRVGDTIKASNYCTDKRFFNVAVSSIMSIQWLKHPTPITQDLIDAMYEMTSGVIERMVTVWMTVMRAYVHLPDEEKDTFVLTAGFIKEACLESNPLLPEYVRQTLATDLSATMFNEDCHGTVAPGVSVDIAKSSIAVAKLSRVSRPSVAHKVYARVAMVLRELGETYPEAVILDVVAKTMELKNSTKLNEDALVTKVLSKIRDHKPPKRKASVTVANQEPLNLNITDFSSDL